MQQTHCCLGSVSTVSKHCDMRSHACGKQCTTSAAPTVHSHCCDKATATTGHPCGCGGVAYEYPIIKGGHADRVVWWLPACQLALRVPNACSQARHAGVCKAREVPCQGATAYHGQAEASQCDRTHKLGSASVQIHKACWEGTHNRRTELPVQI